MLSDRLGSRVVPADFGMTNEQSLANRSLAYHVYESATVDTIP
jgi:hypothetical protein